MDPATCAAVGVEIEYTLFSTRNTTGRSWMPAKFMASCQSPPLVEASPPQAITTRPRRAS
jgi:hypothetical protein